MTEQAGDEPQETKKPKRTKMVNVYNASKRQSFHLGGGRKIGPGMQGKVPLPVWEKVKDRIGWLLDFIQIKMYYEHMQKTWA